MFKFHPIAVATLCGLALSACTKKAPDPLETIPAERIEKALSRLVTKWDHNNDGQATCADVTVLRRQQFIKLDQNNDSRLNNREYRTANFEDKSFVFHDFEKLDANVSGVIELSEFTAVSHSEFRGLDKDDDCRLDMRDAAYSIVAARAQGLGSKGRAKVSDRKQRRQTEELDPFEG